MYIHRAYTHAFEVFPSRAFLPPLFHRIRTRCTVAPPRMSLLLPVVLCPRERTRKILSTVENRGKKGRTPTTHSPPQGHRSSISTSPLLKKGRTLPPFPLALPSVFRGRTETVVRRGLKASSRSWRRVWPIADESARRSDLWTASRPTAHRRWRRRRTTAESPVPARRLSPVREGTSRCTAMGKACKQPSSFRDD